MSKPRIVLSAVLHAGKLYLGKRHGECIMKAVADKVTYVPQDEQGFVDEEGNFLTRAEAMDRAIETGQLKNDIIGGVLTSVDLW